MILQRIVERDKKLVRIFDCKEYICDLGFHQKPDALKVEVMGRMKDFQDLMAENFNDAGGILKKGKRKE